MGRIVPYTEPTEERLGFICNTVKHKAGVQTMIYFTENLFSVY